MALQCGIVGLPNVGKSTLFNCLSSSKAQAANFPFCTIEPNVGVITVPDERLTRLAELVHPGRIVPATVEIVDIAGLVKGASKGEGLGNQFLGNIRQTHAIIHVLRCFDDDNVSHVDGSVDPVRDKAIIDTELQIKDLETVENRLRKVEKIAQMGGDKKAKVEYSVLKAYQEVLEKGLSARTVTFESKEEQMAAHDLFLLTAKPVLYVCNVDEASAVNGNAYVDKVREAIADEHAELLVVAARTEADIAELEDYEERQMFLQDIGLEESGCNRLVKSAYSLLNLRTSLRLARWRSRHGLSIRVGRRPNVQVSSILILKKDLFVQRSSNMRTISAMVLRLLSEKRANWPCRARSMRWRMVISCISVSMSESCWNYDSLCYYLES